MSSAVKVVSRPSEAEQIILVTESEVVNSTMISLTSNSTPKTLN